MPNLASGPHFRLRGRISSSGPNFVFAAEFRLQGRVSSSGPSFVFRDELHLRGRISSAGRISRLQRTIPEPRTLSNSVFGPNFRLQRAPHRISSSQEFRLHGRFSSSDFVFAHNLSFSSLRTISSSKASEFRLGGGDETGTPLSGSIHTGTLKLTQPDAENVPDAEIRRSNSLKLKFGRPPPAGPKIVFNAEFSFRAAFSSSRPNIVFRTEFRLRGRISSSGPSFVFRAQFCL